MNIIPALEQFVRDNPKLSAALITFVVILLQALLGVDAGGNLNEVVNIEAIDVDGM